VKIQLLREPSSPISTLGTIYVNAVWECFSIEDPVRGDGDAATVATWKVQDLTAIPFGTYNVVITDSERFKRPLPLLEAVPGFTGIRIHPGNSSADTSGCILPGMKRAGHDSILESTIAFAGLYLKIAAALAKGEKVTMEIRPVG
jgi:hypothetical protein